MNFKKMTDEELISTRDEVDAWCARHTQSIWSGRKGYAVGLLGVFGVSTGIVFLLFDGFEPVSLVPILLGGVVCLMWYKVKQQHKNNSNFLEGVKEEITRRTKKTEKATKK
ncbi:hypothetical protein SAMN05216339_103203 [Nitrosomonas eutropha]|uniref:Uncharacterized protein n=1 Tax=Nitrosomonas eutropha TaxID=916 RepID=A0A1I7GVS2_9PROT|nr:hypothetical protein [Nitrosomonas eutropha]SFU52522.1 hypothetical protein SAMN05216339_103203 [Nitrosomonas eutropha]